mmetsp:Transcript_33244/g.30182  ORF Transcript_33244/g.30182 Transcript_33244/m.30182 type:complete len:239 (+) Transcript_33244:754-1470(+)
MQNLINSKVSIYSIFHHVTNLLDAAKVDSNQMELHFEVQTILPIMRRVWTVAKELLNKKNLVGEIYVDSKIPPINIDAHFLKKIIFNLLFNGVKFTNRGGVLISISWIKKEKIEDSMFEVTPCFEKHFDELVLKQCSSPRKEALAEGGSMSPLKLNSARNGQPSIDIRSLPDILNLDENRAQEVNDYSMNARVSIKSIDSHTKILKNYTRMTNKYAEENGQEAPCSSNFNSRMNIDTQ